MRAGSRSASHPCRLTTLSMSFQVFSTVLRSAAGCFGGPTASWMASMMPRIRPLLRLGPRPPGVRPLRAAAMSYGVGRQDKEKQTPDKRQTLKILLPVWEKLLHLQARWLSMQRMYNALISGWFLVYYCSTLLLSSIRKADIHKCPCHIPHINNSRLNG